MTSDDLVRENEELRKRLALLSRASLRINESLEFDTVLQEVLDSARSLTGARYGVITCLDDDGQLQDFLFSGLTAEQVEQLCDTPEGTHIFDRLIAPSEPHRTRDLLTYVRSMGIVDFHLPPPFGPVVPFMTGPVIHLGKFVGKICVAETEGGEAFTDEDENTLAMFAAQAAMVIANARRYRDEQRARKDLETVINTSPVGVVVFDARNGAPLSFNREATRIVDRLRNRDQSPEQLLEVISLRRSDGREISLKEFSIAELLSTGETVRAEEIVMHVPDGRSVAVLLNATPIRSEDGVVESLIVTMQDMTELEELERLRAEFLGMVSHELRTPLTSVKGSISTLLDPSAALSPAETTQFFRIIDAQTDRMRQLISDLLDVAHIETGTLSVSPKPEDPVLLVDEARNVFLNSGAENNLHIQAAQDLPLVMADRLRIVQVLGNLLSNAARHSQPSTDIEMTVAQWDLHVAISVVDHGKGVSEERLPNLFRKFTGIDGDQQGPDLGGSGLGLAICKGIMEAHGGRIWAESGGEGKGARFTITIPTVERSDTRVVTESTPGAQASSPRVEERIPILAIDDDPQALRYIRDALSKSGYAPIVTGDPEDAPRLIEEENPHLILLDLVLPGIDGVKLMNEVQEQSDAPIIFVSAYGQDDTIARAFDNGAADYIVKPFSPTEMAARIRAALRKRAASEPAEPYVLGDLAVNHAELQVTLAGRPIRLTAIEYRTLAELAANAGRVLTYGQLLRRVWGTDLDGDVRPMRTAISSLRRKLGDDADDPTYIFTEPRIGYRMPRGQFSPT